MFKMIDELNKNMKYIFREMWKFDKNLVIIIFSCIPISVIISILDLYTPSIVIGTLTREKNVTIMFLTIFFLFFIKNIMLLINNYFSSKKNVSEHKMVLHFISVIAEQKMNVDYDSLENPDIKLKAEKANQAISNNHTDAMQIQNTFAALFINLLNFAIYSTVLCMLNPLLIVLLLVTAAIEYVTIICIDDYENKTKDARVQVSRKLWYVSSISENYSAAKDIRLFGLKGWLQNLSSIFIKEHKAIYNKLARRKIIFTFIDLFVILIRDGFSYWYLITRIMHGQIDVAQFVLYFSTISQFVDILGDVVFSFEGIQRASYQITDIREYLSLEDKFYRGEGVCVPKDSVVVELNNVCYRYPNAQEDTIHNINLKIKENENIALVGLNGAGKTTLIKLIMGMYTPTKGEILINGSAVNKYNRDEYYKLFSAVFQKISVLPISIGKNVMIDDNDISKLEVCLKKADLEKKIRTLRQGYNTLLNKEINTSATELSGGEKQKLMLARALYKNGGVYVLDEPTAALDPIAESQIYEKYNSFTQDKSSIFISHRLASTKFCDRILYLENGTIVEQGTHEELMGRNSKYRELFEMQSQYYR